MSEILKGCPKCGRPVVAHGGTGEWNPTFYDPDSGGEPYRIDCDCGISFCIGCCEYDEFAGAWNRRVGEQNE